MKLFNKVINIFYEEVDDNMIEDDKEPFFKKSDLKYFIFLFFSLLILLSNFIKVDYNIYSGGGLTDTSEFILINDNKVDSNKYFTSHVCSKESTLFSLIFSYIFRWDRVKFIKSIDDDNFNISTNELFMKNSMNIGDKTSIYLALKLNNMDVNIIDNYNTVFFVSSTADTDLRINDKIISIDETDDKKVLFKVFRDGEIIDCYLIKSNEYSLLATYDFDIDNYYGIKFNKGNNVSGGSGGFINFLSIYDSLNDEDLSKGKKISGSGTIDIDGNIGTISGVKYKLKAAVDNDIDIFFVNSDNYKECLELMNEFNYDICLVEVNTAMEAIDYLESR